jgi:hypothetical protein
MDLCREQYEQELQAEDEQYIQADGHLSGQQVGTYIILFQGSILWFENLSSTLSFPTICRF